MKAIASPVIPVSAETAARYAALGEEQKRIVRMRVAIEIGRLSKQKASADSAAAFRLAAAAIGDRARRKGLSLAKIERMVDESR
jgi:hypothetical protein